MEKECISTKERRLRLFPFSYIIGEEFYERSDRCFGMGAVMAKRRMKEKDAILIAGLLGMVLLLMTSPMWVPMIWRAMGPINQSVATVSGSAVKEETKQDVQGDMTEDAEVIPVSGSAVKVVVDESGQTVSTRILTPEGYERTEEEKGSLGEFLRAYPVKKATGVVKLWNGTAKEDQSMVQAVMKLPMEKENLQQVAGSISRVYAEYYFSKEEYNKISFSFADGFKAEYVKWQEGFRIRTDATGSIWTTGGQYEVSKENLKQYMHVVLTYTSADTMKKESRKIKIEDIQIGDVFLQTGETSDAAMVVDVCENEQGQKAFLLAKGGKPAQQFHIIKNPAHEEDPWYYVDEITYPLNAGESSFKKGTLRRLNY